VSDPVQENGVRRRAVLIGAAAVVVVAVVVALVLGLRSGDDEGTAADAAPTTSSAASSAAPSSSAAAPSSATAGDPAAAATTGEASADQLPDSLPAVALDQSVAVSGVSVSLTSIEAIQSNAEGPGNVNGPAVRVTVELTNDTGADLSLDGVSVNLTHGEDLTPGSPLDDVTQAPFTGTAAPGSTVRAVYVFSVPAGERGRVDVSVGVAPGASYAVFSGPVS